MTVTIDEAFETARLVARLEGVPVGFSSGAALTAAIKVGAAEENAGKTIVVIIPSFAERYLSTALFDGLALNRSHPGTAGRNLAPQIGLIMNEGDIEACRKLFRQAFFVGDQVCDGRLALGIQMDARRRYQIAEPRKPLPVAAPCGNWSRCWRRRCDR